MVTNGEGDGQVVESFIWRVLHEAGLTWQRDRSWCATGRVLRKRKSGTVTVTDPDTEPKKS